MTFVKALILLASEECWDGWGKNSTTTLARAGVELVLSHNFQVHRLCKEETINSSIEDEISMEKADDNVITWIIY